jgi:hypothetical protein
MKCLHGERVGALTVVTKSAEVTNRVESQLKQASTLHALCAMHLLASAGCMQAHYPCPLSMYALHRHSHTSIAALALRNRNRYTVSIYPCLRAKCCDKALLPCRSSGPCSVTRRAMEQPLWWRCSVTLACTQSGGCVP